MSRVERSRVAEPEDLPHVVELGVQVFSNEMRILGSAGARALFAAAVARARSEADPLFVAPSDRGVGGFAISERLDATTAIVEWLAVAHEARGRGVGKDLLTRTTLALRRCGYEWVILLSPTAEGPVARMAERIGYERSVPVERHGLRLQEFALKL